MRYRRCAVLRTCALQASGSFFQHGVLPRLRRFGSAERSLDHLYPNLHRQLGPPAIDDQRRRGHRWLYVDYRNSLCERCDGPSRRAVGRHCTHLYLRRRILYVMGRRQPDLLLGDSADEHTRGSNLPWAVCQLGTFSLSRSTAHRCMFLTRLLQVVNWIIAFSTPLFLAKSSSGPYFLFGTCAALTVVVCVLFQPESRGVSLESLDSVFAVSPWRRMLSRAKVRARRHEPSIPLRPLGSDIGA